MWRRNLVFGTALLVLASPGILSAQEEAFRPLELEDLLRQERLRGALGGGEQVAFSPGGELLAFARQRPVTRTRVGNYLGGNERADLWLARVDGGEPVRITDGEPEGAGYWAPIWSPDGERLAFLSSRGGDVRTHVWDRETGEITQVSPQATEPFDTSEPVWLSRTELLVPVLPPGYPAMSLALKRRSPDLATDAWTAILDGGVVTSSVLETGVSVDPTSRPLPQLLLHDAATGSTTVILEGAVRAIHPSPDGSSVAVVLVNEPAQPRAEAPLPLPFPAGNAGATVTVVDRSGAVLGDAHQKVLDVVPGSIHWAPDGSRLSLAASMASESEEGGGAPEVLVFTPGTGEMARPALDGLEPAFAFGMFGTAPPEMRWTRNGHLMVRAREHPDGRPDWWLLYPEGGPRNLTASLPAVPGQLFRLAEGDVWAGVAQGALWRLPESGDPPVRVDVEMPGEISGVVWWDAHGAATHGIEELVVNARDNQGSLSLHRVRLSETPQVEPIRPPGTGARLVGFGGEGGPAAFSRDDRDGLFLWLTPSGPGEPRTLVRANGFLSEIEEPEARRIRYESLDGDSLTAWVLLPPRSAPDLAEGGRLPLVTWVYGGHVGREDRPHSTASLTYRGGDNLLLYTSRGYAVLIPSIPLPPPHLSGDPYEAIPSGVLPAVDRAVELGIADEDRLAVMGTSYGGYTALSLITQTNRFRAAISEAGASNLVSMYGQLDARYRYDEFSHEDLGRMMLLEFAQYGMGGPPWEDMERYVRNSPITHAGRIETPVLLIHGDLDYVALQQAEELFSSLQRQGKRARFVRYWGEGHGIANSANMRDRWEQIFRWLDEHFAHDHSEGYRASDAGEDR
jgi:dipeptidyl aminopeptidase/acylaminoacyl peptidase